MVQKTSGMATAALIFGILSLIFGWIPILGWAVVVLAIIFAVKGMKATDKKNVKGKGMAIAGLVMGLLGALFAILVFIMVLFFLFAGLSLMGAMV